LEGHNLEEEGMKVKNEAKKMGKKHSGWDWGFFSNFWGLVTVQSTI